MGRHPFGGGGCVRQLVQRSKAGTLPVTARGLTGWSAPHPAMGSWPAADHRSLGSGAWWATLRHATPLYLGRDVQEFRPRARPSAGRASFPQAITASRVGRPLQRVPELATHTHQSRDSSRRGAETIRSSPAGALERAARRGAGSCAPDRGPPGGKVHRPAPAGWHRSRQTRGRSSGLADAISDIPLA